MPAEALRSNGARLPQIEKARHNDEPFNYGIQEFDKPLCYAADLRRGVHQTVHKEQIC